MGLQADIDQIGYHMRKMRIVDRQNNQLAGIGTNVFRELAGDRFVTLKRERSFPVAGPKSGSQRRDDF
jgi:hypothetical protein